MTAGAIGTTNKIVWSTPPGSSTNASTADSISDATTGSMIHVDGGYHITGA